MRRTSAQTRRIWVWCVVALLPLAVLATSSIVLASRQVTSVVDDQVRSTATVSSVVIGQQTDNLVALVHSYTTRQSLVIAMSGGSGSDTSVAQNLSSLAGAVPGISASFIADLHGTSVATYPYFASAIGKNFAYREWFTGLVASGQPYVSSAIQTAEDDHTLAITVTDYIRDRKGTPIAVLGVNYSLDSITSFARQVGRAQGITLRVTDRAGTSLTEGGKHALSSLADDPRVVAARAGRTGLRDYTPTLADGTQGPTELSAYAPVIGTGWTVIVSKNKHDAFAGLVRLRETVLGITALLVLILLLGVRMMARADRRRRDAELLAVSRERELDAVLAATPDFTFVADLATGAVVYASREQEQAGTEVLDVTSIGDDGSAALVHSDDRARLDAVHAAAVDLDDGEVLQLRYRAQSVTGGPWRWLSRRITPFRRDPSGAVVEVLGVVRDVTEAMEYEDRLTHAALHDSLTGLPNRALLIDRLEAALARSERDGREVAVLFCDLDGFKQVNDIAGHAVGDEVLLELSGRLRDVLREHDTVARVGGDEFVIIVEPWRRPSSLAHDDVPDSGFDDERGLAVRVAERVGRALRQPVTVNGVDHTVSVSIGITYATLGPGRPGGEVSAEQVLQDADMAMYLAKGGGKDRFEVFERGPKSDPTHRGRVERVLREALARLAQTGRPAEPGTPTFGAVYQPVFDAGSGELIGFEALARLTDGDGVVLPPDVFVPVAEESGLIHPLGRAMLGIACSQLSAWRSEVPGLEGVRMAVNMSALQAQHSSLADDVRGALTTHGLAPSDLVLELTETALLQVANSTITTLRGLRDEGIGIAIDDFGIGYASLRYLATLPVSAVKIDRSFTAGLPDDATSHKIIRAVAALADDMGLDCVVEGVETVEQRDALPTGVQLQGFLTGRPQAPELMDVLLLCTQGVPVSPRR